MAHAVRMPRPGQMTEECLLTTWLKAEGDPVASGDVLFEIETDKATMEVESFHDGVLLRRVVDAGQVVPVNAVCAWIGQPGEAIPDVDEAPPLPAASDAPAPETPPPGDERATSRAVDDRAVASGATASDAGGTRGPAPISPRALRRAAEAGLDPAGLQGTGPRGRIVERDVLAAIEAAPPGGAAMPPLGRAAGSGSEAGLPTDDQEEPVPLSRLRRVIAERLTRSATTVPTFTITVSADVTRVLELRDELRDAGIRLTVTDVVLAATAQTLAEFPDLNSRTDGTTKWVRRRVHLGIAVARPAGLVVAVLHDADRLGLLELHDRAAALVDGARAGTLGPDDLAGSTFTVTNLGMLGVEEFAAIINPGESGILAVASAVPTPVAIGDGIAVHQVMKLTLTADHRIVDGELGARFLGALRRRLEDAAAIRRQLASS